MKQKDVSVKEKETWLYCIIPYIKYILLLFSNSHDHVFFNVISVDDLFTIFSSDEQDNPNYTRYCWKWKQKVNDNELTTEFHVMSEMNDVYSPQLAMETLSM